MATEARHSEINVDLKPEVHRNANAVVCWQLVHMAKIQL